MVAHPGNALQVSELQRLSDSFTVHLAAAHPRAVSALLGTVVYGVIPTDGDPQDCTRRAARIGTEFLTRVGSRLPIVIGIGPLAPEASDLPRAPEGAERALRVLRESRTGINVAHSSDVQAQALLLDVRDLASTRGEQIAGPVARLVQHDQQHRTSYVSTLRAWLDAFGDLKAAAASVYAHPNTLRYRLRRLSEISGLDLTDPEARFAAMLQLRILPSESTAGR